ncbi:MAG: metallophosphoesterase [Clostridia bacterium]|nr:metallophosphoesterase [Clostridia bacterium]
MYYFSCDTHLSDNHTLIVDHRPFKNTKAFDKFIIKTWNKQAKKGDTIFVIGDFVDCDGTGHEGWRKSILLVKKFKADIVLIMGNNEDRIVKYFFDNDFEAFKSYCLSIGYKDVHKNLDLEFMGQKFYLTHKPINYKPNVINLFGHTHRSGGLYKPFGFNLGCDINHFRLYSEDDIKHLIELKKQFWDKDKSLNMTD